MIASPELSPVAVNSLLNKRLRPQNKFKLNVNITNHDEKDVTIQQNSTSSYTLQNCPLSTDLTTSLSSSNCFAKKIFFGTKYEQKSPESYTQIGDSYYVVQKSNGKDMQDTYKVRTIESWPGLSFFAVYDGHSTHFIAELLAQKLDEFLVESLNAGLEMTSAIKQAFMKAENEVMATLQESKLRGGSTALCAVIYNDMLYVANLGDSRAVIFQENSHVSLSNLHDFTNTSETSHVESRGGVVLNNRLGGELAVSRSFGDIMFKQYMNKDPEITVHQIQEVDQYLLLGTDGYWNGLNSEQTLELMQSLKGEGSLDMKFCGDYLIDKCCEKIRTKKDNMTLICIDIKKLAAGN